MREGWRIVEIFSKATFGPENTQTTSMTFQTAKLRYRIPWALGITFAAILARNRDDGPAIDMTYPSNEV